MRKAFARRQRARRWLTWRYIAGGIALVLVAGFGIYALYFSDWLRVERVEVTGNRQLADRDILAAAEVPIGDTLASLDLEAVSNRVSSLAAIKSVDVSRTWPHAVRIVVVERTPIAVLQPGGTSAIDEGGNRFPASAAARKDLPKVKVGAGANKDALREAASVVAALDDQVAALVDYLEVQTVDEIRLQLKDGRVVRWGSADQSEDKAAVLLPLLKREAKTYDVSVPGAPTTR